MAEEDHLRTLGHTGPQVFDYLIIARDGKGDGLVYVASATERAVEAPGAIRSAVFVVGREDFVAGLEIERARHDVDSVGGVGDEDEVIRIAMEVEAEVHASLSQQVVDPPAEELDRLGLKLTLPPVIPVEDRLRARAKAAMVQESNTGPQEKCFARPWPGQAKRRVIHS